MIVECEIEYIDLESDRGLVESVRAICSYCGNETMSYGTSGASVRRCLVMMREECPEDESNYYVADYQDHE